MMEKKNKRQLSQEKTRKNILKVSTELFMKKGYKNTSTREIAQQVEITQPNLYHHFKNKQELYFAVIQQLTDQVRTELAIVIEKPDSIEQKLEEMIRILLDKHPLNLFMMIHDIIQETGDEYHKRFYQIFQITYLDNIEKLLATSPDAHLRPNVNEKDAARFILYNVSALLSIEKVYHRKSPVDHISQYVQLILYGLIQ